jgi:peptide/nickel transport system permease protein
LRVGGTAGAVSWGETMSEFRDAPTAWWLLAFPGAFLFATIVALNLVGEARREALDPRAR